MMKRRVHGKTIRNLTDADKAYIIERYTSSDDRLTDIADVIGCSTTTITVFARKEGIARDASIISERNSVMCSMSRSKVQQKRFNIQ